MKLTIIAAATAATIPGKSGPTACSGLNLNEGQTCSATDQGQLPEVEPMIEQGCSSQSRFPQQGTEQRLPQSRFQQFPQSRFGQGQIQFRPDLQVGQGQSWQSRPRSIDPLEIIQSAKALNLKLDKLQEFMQAAEQMKETFKQDFIELKENIKDMRQNLQSVASLEKMSQVSQMDPDQNLKIAACAKGLNAKLSKLQQFLQTGEAIHERFMEQFGAITNTIQEIQMDLTKIEALQNIGQVSEQGVRGNLYKRYVDVDVERPFGRYGWRDVDVDVERPLGRYGWRDVDVEIDHTPDINIDVGAPGVRTGLNGPAYYGAGLYRGWNAPYNYWGSNLGYYAPGYWGGYGYGAYNRGATLAQCHSLAAGQTTGYMRDAYLAACSAYY